MVYFSSSLNNCKWSPVVHAMLATLLGLVIDILDYVTGIGNEIA